MGVCNTKIKKNRDYSMDFTDKKSGKASRKVQIIQKIDLFAHPTCPIDNEEIERVEKQLNGYQPNILGLKGKLVQQWKVIQFRKPCVKRQWWYYGEWKDSQLHGRGSLFNQAHEYLVTGVFSYGNLFKSMCQKIYDDGAYYIGSLNENLDPEGEGQLTTISNRKIIGSFAKGVPHGKVLELKENHEFQGTFQNGLKKYGILKTSTSEYEGPFLNNMKHGIGKLILQDGEIYEGQFEKDKRQGNGSLYTEKKKLIYKGKWKNDKTK